MGSTRSGVSLLPILLKLLIILRRCGDCASVEGDNVNYSAEKSANNDNDSTIIKGPAPRTLPFLSPENIFSANPPMHDVLLASSRDLGLNTPAEMLKDFLKSRGLSLPLDPTSLTTSLDPVELNKFLARLKPKQGRLDPNLLLDKDGFVPNVFGNLFSSSSPRPKQVRHTTKRVDKEELWNPSGSGSSGPSPLTDESPKFSSKFRGVNNNNATDHITDPNIRNHRLFEYEDDDHNASTGDTRLFETYQNFTHIDQAEDLLADSSEIPPERFVVRVKPPPGFNYTPSTTPGWVPKPRPNSNKKDSRDANLFTTSSRPVSMEGAGFDSNGDFVESSEGRLTPPRNIPPNVFLPFPATRDSDTLSDPSSSSSSIEPLHNQLRPPGGMLREPLRESSTENLVFITHPNGKMSLASASSSSSGNKFRSEEIRDIIGSSNNKNIKFRPSPTDKILSPPVFVDPDQDFFTSTIRNDESQQQPQQSTPLVVPRRRHKNPRLEYGPEDFHPINGDSLDHTVRHRKRKPSSEEESAVTTLAQDPRPYPPLEDSDLPFPPPRSTTVGSSGVKSDRVLDDRFYNPQDGGDYHQQGPPIFHQYAHFPQHYAFGPASNEAEFQYNPQQSQQQNSQEANPYNHRRPSSSRPHNQDNLEMFEEGPSSYKNPSKSGVIVAHNGDQIYAGGHIDKYAHPFADPEAQPEYSTYSFNSNEGWSNTYWILGGLIVLSAITAFLLPSIIRSVGRNRKNRDDLQDENTEYFDDQTMSSTTVSNSNTETSPPQYTYGGGSSSDDPLDQDPTADTDLWTEIKGVYNDVVKIVRGDYGGIVNKLTSTVGGGNKDKYENPDKVGPNIVYRDEEVLDEPADDHYEDIELEVTPIHNSKRHRKNRLKNRKGKDDLSLVSSTTHTSAHRKRPKKNRNIQSTINYVVSNSSPMMNLEDSKYEEVLMMEKENSEEEGVETSRSASDTSPRNNLNLIDDTMATFYLGPSSSFSTNGGGPTTTTSTPIYSSPSSMDSFLGEWAKVQLIGSSR